jgi:predicted nucleic acid-binding protein
MAKPREVILYLSSGQNYEVKFDTSSSSRNSERIHLLTSGSHIESVDLDWEIALQAAKLSIQFHLHMADAFIYSTALRYAAQLFTSDTHFGNLPGVTVL